MEKDFSELKEEEQKYHEIMSKTEVQSQLGQIIVDHILLYNSNKGKLNQYIFN